MATLTRRGLLLGGAAVAAGGFGLWGRYGIGGAFEDHLAETLGLPREVIDQVLPHTREEIGADYDLHAAAFLLATTAPSRHIIPGGWREQAIRSFVETMFGATQMPTTEYGTPLTYAYVGLRSDAIDRPCAVLIRREGHLGRHGHHRVRDCRDPGGPRTRTRRWLLARA